MEAFIIGTSGILIGFACGWLLRARGKRSARGKNADRGSPVSNIPRAGCHMCGRVRRSDDYSLWKIRGQEMNVCGRCHPFFKERFERGRLDGDDTTTGLEQASA